MNFTTVAQGGRKATLELKASEQNPFGIILSSSYNSDCSQSNHAIRSITKNTQVMRLCERKCDRFQWAIFTLTELGSEESKFVAEAQFPRYLSRPIV